MLSLGAAGQCSSEAPAVLKANAMWAASPVQQQRCCCTERGDTVLMAAAGQLLCASRPHGG